MSKTQELRAVGVTATPSGSGEDAPLSRQGALAGSQRQPSTESFPILTDDQFARCVNIWSALRSGHMTRDEANREIQYVEQGLPRCESCEFRSGVVREHFGAYLMCGECENAGRRP
jgi:hypothetical protein